MGFRWGSLIISLVTLLTVSVRAQDAASINKELGGSSILVSNKAMSIFLANKLSYYPDFSLYKNYVTLNTAEGNVNITHNFHQPADSDAYVRSFVRMGARLNIANTFAANYAGKYVANQLSLLLEKTWLSRPVIKFGEQAPGMAAKRALIVQQLAAEINQKSQEFEQSLNLIKAEEVSGQDVSLVRAQLTRDFYTQLRAAYLQRFSQAQADQLLFNTVALNWTSIAVYIPVIRQRFEVSPAAGQAMIHRYNYPLELSVTHTRLLESRKYGKFIMSAQASGKYNNSVQSGELLPANMANSYSGDYKNFLTPALAGKIVYFPPTSHFGISYRLEKNFGTYNALNSILGIPIVLIDKREVPVVNFEVQLLYMDRNQKQLPANKIAVGLTVGIPFSKVVL